MISNKCSSLFLGPFLSDKSSCHLILSTYRQTLKKTKRAISGIKRAGLFSIGILIIDYSNDRPVPDMMMKEEHEAREVETCLPVEMEN
jgi:hypothetical protein